MYSKRKNPRRQLTPPHPHTHSWSVKSVWPVVDGEVSSVILIQSNLDGSNTDGSSTMAYSNSFLSPYGIFPIAQENKYLGNFLIL